LLIAVVNKAVWPAAKAEIWRRIFIMHVLKTGHSQFALVMAGVALAILSGPSDNRPRFWSQTPISLKEDTLDEKS
jgi:hypothetical protein